MICDDSSETYLSEGFDLNGLSLYNNTVKPIQVYEKDYYKNGDKKEPVTVPSWRMKERVLPFFLIAVYLEFI
jgi:hypothetical protein